MSSILDNTRSTTTTTTTTSGTPGSSVMPSQMPFPRETRTRQTFLVLLIIISLIFPPLGVFILDGCSLSLLLNVILTIFGYFPGIIHALFLVIVANSNAKHSPHLVRTVSGPPSANTSSATAPTDVAPASGSKIIEERTYTSVAVPV